MKKDEQSKLQELQKTKPAEIAVEEFAILELEDRLELADRCNTNCKCPAP